MKPRKHQERDELIKELATVFNRADHAEELLERIGFLVERRPVFSPDPHTFWRKVCKLIQDGQVPEERLVPGALELWPENATFKRLVGMSLSAGTGHQGIAPENSTASGPTWVTKPESSSRVRWRVIVSVVALVISATVLHMLDKRLNTRQTFPQFGRGYFRDNVADASMQSRHPPCNQNCLKGVKRILDINANFGANRGYAMVNFNKVTPFSSDLAKLLQLRIEVLTENPHFEVTLADSEKNSLFFTCTVEKTGRVEDLRIDLTDRFSSSRQINIQTWRIRGFYIGFASDSGSGIGNHHMRIYGITEASPDLPSRNYCKLRDTPR